ncbi:MAG: hypothetical protein HOL49_08650 [Gammaproteobacteria bacterium]|jgi:hypothetical protein|nr:hypothetical protein [Gammaproteobacteria bacterium]
MIDEGAPSFFKLEVRRKSELSHTNTVLCMKWGTAFAAQDINLLYRSCKAYTKSTLRFICLTDDVRDLDVGIETRDIPDIGLTPAEIALRGVWRKLSLYAQELHDLGRVLFIDLDMMVVGPLDDFFAVSRGMTFQNMGDSWRRNSKSDHREGGTCIFSFDPAEEYGILQAFLENKSSHIGNYRNEQDFAFGHASSTAFWPNDYVISFKRHLCRRYGAGLFKGLRAVPEGALVIAFHGDPRPRDVAENPVWGPFPHLHCGTPALVRDYWLRFGAPV